MEDKGIKIINFTISNKEKKYINYNIEKKGRHHPDLNWDIREETSSQGWRNTRLCDSGKNKKFASVLLYSN